MSCAATAGHGLADLVEPLQVGRDLLPQVGAVLEAGQERAVDLARHAEFAGGDGRRREVVGEAHGELFLLGLSEALHQLAIPRQRNVELAGVGAGHRQDDLGEGLDGPVGIGLQVLVAQLLGLAEPVVLDRPC